MQVEMLPVRKEETESHNETTDEDTEHLIRLLKQAIDLKDDDKTRRSHSTPGQSSSRPSSARRNYSFTGEAAREIDRENKRLRERLATPKSRSLLQFEGRATPSASALNRRRADTKIQRENQVSL